MLPAAFPKEALLRAWTAAAPEGVVSELSGVVEGADHAWDGEEGRKEGVRRVVEFLAGLGGG